MRQAMFSEAPSPTNGGSLNHLSFEGRSLDRRLHLHQQSLGQG
jgi:hypothetical protein